MKVKRKRSSNTSDKQFTRILLFLMFCVILYIVPTSTQAQTKPNIIVIVTDDQPPWMVNIQNNRAENPWISTDALEKIDSAYNSNGQVLLDTPNLAQMAKAGVYFNKAYLTIGQCSGSRASVLTSTMPFTHGLINNGDALPVSNPTLPRSLTQAGYETYLLGKCHLGGSAYYEEQASEFLTGPTKSINAYAQQLGFTSSVIMNPDLGQWHNWYNFKVSKLLNNTTYIEHVGIGKPRSGKNELFTPYTAYNTNYLTEEAIDAMNQNAKTGKPFFIWLSYLAPHPPLYSINLPPGVLYAGDKNLPTSIDYYYDVFDVATEDPDRSLFSQKELAAASRFNSLFWNEHASIRNVSAYQNPDYLASKPPQQTNSKPSAEYKQTNPNNITATLQRTYHIAENIDANVGRIWRAVEDNNIQNNTILIYIHDNGVFWGEHQMRQKGPTMYDEMLRTPLIVYGPGYASLKNRGTIESLVSTMDIAPTILDFAKVAIPEQFQGNSMKPFLEGKANNIRDAAMMFYAAVGATGNDKYPMRGVITEDGIKFVHYLPSMISGGEQYDLEPATYDGLDFELYDLYNDPFEINNLLDRRYITWPQQIQDNQYSQKLKNALFHLARFQSLYDDSDEKVPITNAHITHSGNTITAFWNTNDKGNTHIRLSKRYCASCTPEDIVDMSFVSSHQISAPIDSNTVYDISMVSMTEQANGGVKNNTYHIAQYDLNTDAHVNTLDFGIVYSSANSNEGSIDINGDGKSNNADVAATVSQITL